MDAVEDAPRARGMTSEGEMMSERSGMPGAPQRPDAPGDGSGGVPPLPDFRRGAGPADSAGSGAGHGGSGEHGGSGGHGPGSPAGGGSGGRRPLIALLAGGAGCLVVILAVLALVLSQTVFRADPESPTADPESSTALEEIPEQTSAADPDAVEAEPPTVPCTTPDDDGPPTEQEDGVVRGGGLQFTAQEGWEVGTGWESQSTYMVDVAFADQPVEDGWYSVVGVGAVEFPEDEGGYPGAEEAARAIFQCGIHREQAQRLYGSPAQLTNYRDEATTVDGHDAWIVSADVLVSDLALMDTADAWRIVVIVVDAPEGPSAFDGGAAVGHDQQVADLDAMVESLRAL